MAEDKQETNPFSWRRELKEARQRIGVKLLEERDYQELGLESPWLYYNLGLESYLQSFKGLVKEDELELQATDETSAGLDMMGQAQVLRDLHIKGLGVTLTDPRLLPQKEEDAKKKIDILAGDVLSSQTYRGIKGWLQENGLTGFNLIFVRPLGGANRLPKDEHGLYLVLLKRLWKLLKPGGIILSEVPAFIPEGQISEFTDKCKRTNIQAAYVNQPTELIFREKLPGGGVVYTKQGVAKDNPVKIKLIKPDRQVPLPDNL